MEDCYWKSLPAITFSFVEKNEWQGLWLLSKKRKEEFLWNTHRRQQTKGTAWKQCGEESGSNQLQEGPLADENLSSESWEITADGPLPLDLYPLSKKSWLHADCIMLNLQLWWSRAAADPLCCKLAFPQNASKTQYESLYLELLFAWCKSRLYCVKTHRPHFNTNHHAALIRFFPIIPLL